ncbi:MAG: NAD(P)H-dependent oxidoreductase subunit E [Spirochaetaceae bacterium]
MCESGDHSEECARDFRERLDAVLARHRPDPTRLIPLLQDVQREFDYLPEEAMRGVARHLRIAETRVYGVVTFYAQFTLTPRGENVITVCNGTACHVRGGDKILDDLSRTLGVKPGETTPNGKHTLESAACFGSCALAPVVIVNGTVHGSQSPRSVGRLVKAAT